MTADNNMTPCNFFTNYHYRYQLQMTILYIIMQHKVAGRHHGCHLESTHHIILISEIWLLQ